MGIMIKPLPAGYAPPVVVKRDGKCPECCGTPSKESWDKPFCVRCAALNRKGWPVKHSGPIEAGSYIAGIHGFVWGNAKDRKGIELYGIGANEGPSTIAYASERLIRSLGIERDNPGGTVVRGKL